MAISYATNLDPLYATKVITDSPYSSVSPAYRNTSSEQRILTTIEILRSHMATLRSQREAKRFHNSISRMLAGMAYNYVYSPTVYVLGNVQVKPSWFINGDTISITTDSGTDNITLAAGPFSTLAAVVADINSQIANAIEVEVYTTHRYIGIRNSDGNEGAPYTISSGSGRSIPVICGISYGSYTTRTDEIARVARIEALNNFEALNEREDDVDVVIVPDIIISDQATTFGDLTLLGAGAFTPTYTGEPITSVVINSGDPSGHFEDDGSGNLVVSAAGVGNLSGPYNLNVTYNGKATIDLTITIVADMYSVASGAQINSAISDNVNNYASAGGVTVRCREGSFEGFIRGGVINSFTSPIIIDSDGVTSIDYMKFAVGIDNIEIDGLTFTYNAASPHNELLFIGIGITIVRNCSFVGTATGYRNIGDPVNGSGIAIGSGTVEVYDSLFTNLTGDIFMTGGSNHIVQGCTFEYTQGENLNVAGDCSNVFIGGLGAGEGNLFHLRYGSDYALNHDDVIQVYGRSGAAVNVDGLHIYNNVVIQAPNDDLNPAQIFFGRHEDVETAGTFPIDGHTNFDISGNVIYASGSHQISMNSVIGYNTDNNTVIKSYENTGGTGAHITYGTDIQTATVDNNIAPNFIDSSGAVLSTRNFLTTTFNYGSQVDQIYIFKNPQEPHATMTIEDLVINPFGPAHTGDDSGFGSPLTYFDESLPSSLTAHAFRKWDTTNTPLTITVDASYSADASGLMTGGNATFDWDWGDGSPHGTGISAQHTYTTTGTYTITLTVTRNSDSATAVDTITHITYDSTVVDFDFSDGATTLGTGSYTVVQVGTRSQVLDGSEYGQRITEGNEVRIESTGANSGFWGTSEISFEIDFALVSGAGNGSLMSANSGFGIDYNSGTQEITYYQDDEANTRWSITTSGLGLANTDTSRHVLKASYSASKGVMELVVDDVSYATGLAGSVTGNPPSSTGHIYLGAISFGTSTSFDVYDTKIYYLDINDMTPNLTVPALSSSTPADNAVGVSVDANIVLTFNIPVVPVPGSIANITLHRTSDDVEVASWNVMDDVPGDTKSGTLTGIYSATITLASLASLDAATEYYLLIPGNAFQSAGGTAYVGISDTTALSFTTA